MNVDALKSIGHVQWDGIRNRFHVIVPLDEIEALTKRVETAPKYLEEQVKVMVVSALLADGPRLKEAKALREKNNRKRMLRCR